MNLLKLTPAQFCAETDACDEGRKFAVKHLTMADVWDNCPRADWLLWIARKVKRGHDSRTLRLFGLWCTRFTPLGDGRVTGDLPIDPRSLGALEVAEWHAHGQATDVEFIAINAAARAAYAVAYTEAFVLEPASAAYQAVASSYRRAQRATRRAQKGQADQFRRMVANPFRAKEGKP